jgi:callose synthase
LLSSLVLFCFSNNFSFQELGNSERDDPAKFALVWNEIINSFRLEDLISNRYVSIIFLQFKFQQVYFFPSNLVDFAESWI